MRDKTTMKYALTIFLFPIFAALSMENDELYTSSQALAKNASRKIEIITDPNKQNSYTVAISLCIKQSDRGSFAEKIQKIYNTHNLNLTYIDEGRFWQTPHVTLVIFEKVKLQNIECFHSIFGLLENTSLQFIPTTCKLFGKGDWLVTMPSTNIAAKIKELNAGVIEWAQGNVPFNTYKIQNNTSMKKITPHMALNTTVSTANWDEKRYIIKAINKDIKSVPIALEDVTITATNTWS